MKNVKNILWLILIPVVIVAAGIFYYHFDPNDVSIPMPKCIFRQLTGWQCPGCGAQRAVHDLLHGDVIGAISHNIFFVIAVPFLLLTAYAVFMVKRGNPSAMTLKLYNFVTSRYTLLSYVAVYCIWWVVRNCIGC